jgi:alpha-glucoside transport system substrate-binding protein
MQRSRGIKILAAVAAFGLVAAACGSDDDSGSSSTDPAGTAASDTDSAGTAASDTGDGDTGGASAAADADFTLFGAPTGIEGTAVEGFLDVYNEQTGSSIDFTGSDDLESQLRIRVDGGDPPDVAFLPQPGQICDYADAGALVSLEDMGFDIAQLEEDHSQYWVNLGLCEDGMHYGVPWYPNFKSIVFYHKPTFEEKGYEIPETYEDMIALSEQIVADGLTPWCMGYESAGATGWAGTDWIEDILVRQAGSDFYAQWYNHEVPFNSPEVVEAFDTYGEILFGEGFVLGGAENVAGIAVTDSPSPLFEEPPGCLMLKQGSFATNWFPDAPGYEEGEVEAELDVFPFPSIDGNVGAMGGGDTIVVFEGSDANIQVVKDWITPEWLCTHASATGGGIAEYGGHGVDGVEFLPGHKDVDPACYVTDAANSYATAVTEALAANTFVFDASDLMDPAVGQGTFWTGMVDWSRGTSAQDVADSIEASWPS